MPYRETTGDAGYAPLAADEASSATMSSGGGVAAAEPVGRSDTSEGGRLRKASRKLLAGLAAARVLRGKSFEDLALEVNVARRMKADAAAGAAPPSCQQALRQGRAVYLDGGPCFASACFVPHAKGKEELALVSGVGNSQLVLHDVHTLLETGVAVETEGEFMFGIRLSPDRCHACVGIGLDGRARLAVLNIGQAPPWCTRWSEVKGKPVMDADFSADGSVVACVAQTVQQIDLHDAEDGSLLRSVPFGVASVQVPATNYSFTLRFTADFLVVSGGYKTEDEKAVGVWRLKNLTKDGDKMVLLSETTVVAEVTPTKLLMYDSIVGPVATCKKHVCVGAADGSVNLHEIVDHGAFKDVQDRCIRLAEPMESSQAKTEVTAVSFSHSGDKLATAWATGEVAVFDTSSTARLARFSQDDRAGAWDMLVLAFSADDSLLAMGGGFCATVTVHRLVAQRPRQYAIPGSSAQLSSAAVSAQHVALVSGSRIVVKRHDGVEVADFDTGDPIYSSSEISPIKLRPRGGHVAVVLSNETVAVYSFEVPEGRLVFRAEDLEGTICSVRYSPDSSQLLVAAYSAAVYVLEANTGKQIHALTAAPDYAMVADVAVDPATKRIVCTNWGGEGGLHITDPETGTKVRSFDQDLDRVKFQWPVVDAAGQRLAYMRVGATGRTIVVRSLDGEGKCLASFEGKAGSVEAPVGPKGFHGDWLLCCEWEMEETASSDVTLKNLDNPGTEVELNTLLSAVLGAGYTAHGSVGWVPSTASPTIHATVGSELVFVDLQHLETQQADGCLHAQLLMDLCGDKTGRWYQPEVIDAIVKNFPDCINVPKRIYSSDGTLRDALIGETVLHHCAKQHQTEAVKRWLPIERGIYTPISSGSRKVKLGEKEHICRGWTALHEAIDRSNKDMVLHLLGTLNTSMNFVTAELINDAVMLMAHKMPYLMPNVLRLLDDRLVRTESTIEISICIQRDAYVSGRDTLVDMQSSEPGDQPDPQTWGVGSAPDPIRSSSRQEGSRTAQFDIKVVQIANFIGPSDRSPFQTVVERCDFSVCESTIMKAAIDFKWQQVRWWVCVDLGCYMVSLVVASTTMVGFAWTALIVDGSSSDHSSAPKTLFVLMIFFEAFLLVLEVIEMAVHRRRWLNTYNIINVSSILLLFSPAAMHIVAHEWYPDDIAWQRFSTELLQNLGSVGLGFKWLGLLGYLNSFQCKPPVHCILENEFLSFILACLRRFQQDVQVSNASFFATPRQSPSI